MFKRLYDAGKFIAENKLGKLIWSKTMTPEEKTEATGMLGLGLGTALRNVAIGGMLLLALAAVSLGAAPGGLSVLAFAALGAGGTALAGIGTLGLGMRDKGDEIAGGIMAQSREMRKDVMKIFWNGLRGQKPQASEFAPGAKPAAESFSAAVAGMSSKGMAVIPTTAPAPSSAPEIK